MLKSFRNFIGESEDSGDSISDIQRLYDLGIVDAAEYLKKSLEQGIVPNGWREVEVSFEFDWTWADQTRTKDAIGIVKEMFAGFGPDLPTGCWVDPGSIEVDPMGWGLRRSTPAYHESAYGAMTMLVPDSVLDQRLEEWADEMEGRVFSACWIGEE
jgi:hypothetical protein